MTNWLNIPNTAPEGVIPMSVKFSFYAGAIVFFLAVLWTVLRSREYSPEELASFEETAEHSASADGPREAIPAETGYKKVQIGSGALVLGLIATYLFIKFSFEKELLIVSGGTAAAGAMWLVAGTMQKNGKVDSQYVNMIHDIAAMPKTMKQLAVVQFFSWFPLFAMWIYTTAAVTQHVYGATDTTSEAYNTGADWVGWCFAVYNGVAALVAFGIPILAKKTNRRVTHMICLIAGGLGLISIFFINDPYMLLVSMVGIGIAWASILSMPYAMLAGALPADKMGYYMGVFNYFIVIPQLVAASILGALVKGVFGGDPIYALLVGGIVMIIGGVITLRVDDVDDPLAQ